jgi:hypothetical protein
LTETDFILTKTALYPFEDEASKKESNYLKKFLEYKEPKAYNGMDCDVNLYSVVMYGLLEYGNDFDLNKIEKQDSIEKYQIIENGERFRGDTLTSALTFIKKYLTFLWCEIDNGRIENNGFYSEFYDLFTANKTSLKTKDEKMDNKNYKWDDYALKYSDIIWNVMDESVKEFLRVYQMFGNYMCIPGKSYFLFNNKYEWCSFNTLRSNGGYFDSVDALLSNIYAYFKYNNEVYLYMLLGGKGKEDVVEETKKWLEDFYENNWNIFVEKNCLRAFVDKDLKPISMKTGQAIPDDILEKGTYYCKLESYEESLVFFEQLSKRIVWRTIDIYKKVRE